MFDIQNDIEFYWGADVETVIYENVSDYSIIIFLRSRLSLINK